MFFNPSFSTTTLSGRLYKPPFRIIKYVLVANIILKTGKFKINISLYDEVFYLVYVLYTINID